MITKFEMKRKACGTLSTIIIHKIGQDVEELPDGRTFFYYCPVCSSAEPTQEVA